MDKKSMPAGQNCHTENFAAQDGSPPLSALGGGGETRIPKSRVLDEAIENLLKKYEKRLAD
ncbi:ribbon-helix-helix domain-containing protein [Lawsonibacter celer]|uniref:ribbon-helix-helix domain-containing protein n=1 Tax=Lawsonibacter celer TaxID=2986526 RepID=UPI00311AA931